jgi:DNA-binding XRE family transcriptional regulator
MDSREFSDIRHYLGKSQNQLALLLCVSLKSIESFEQGWRNIPVHVERQLLFLLWSERARPRDKIHCWERNGCPAAWRKTCPAYQSKDGQPCWFINGTFVRGIFQKTWAKKMEMCRQCPVFQEIYQQAETACRKDGSMTTLPVKLTGKRSGCHLVKVT